MPINPDHGRFAILPGIIEASDKWLYEMDTQIQRFMMMYRADQIKTQGQFLQTISDITLYPARQMLIPMGYNDFSSMMPEYSHQIEGKGAAILEGNFGVKLQRREDTMQLLGRAQGSVTSALDHAHTRQRKSPLTQYYFTVGRRELPIRVNATLTLDNNVDGGHGTFLNNGLRAALAELFLWDEPMFKKIERGGMYLAVKPLQNGIMTLKCLLMPQDIAIAAGFGETANLGLYFARDDDEIGSHLGRSEQMMEAFKLMAKSPNYPVGAVLTG